MCMMYAFICGGAEVWVIVHVCARAYGDHWLTLDVFLDCTPLCVLRQCLSLYLENIDLSRIADQ